jgi:TonB family protein
MNGTQIVQTRTECPPGYPNSQSRIYYKKMSAVPPLDAIQQPEPVPRLLVELPSRPRVFFSNLRDLIFPRRLPSLELQSTPAPFWPDVLVKRGLPWTRFLQSIAYHVLAFALLIAFTRFFALQPQVVAKPTFDRAQVIYYTPSEYLPPLDTRDRQAAQPAKADPEFSLQPIISVPLEADNRSQTIVTPPNVKLKHDVALPNIVAWSDKLEKPQLAIPSVPLTPAAEITRIAPQIENAIVQPPPDAADLAQRRNLPTPQNPVVAPPPDVSASNASEFQAPQPALIAPPPSIENASTRPLGDLNIGPSSVIAPAPRLPMTEQRVAEQRAVAGSRLSGVGGGTPQVVAPPPSLSASGSSAGSFGSPGRIIALNLHPAVGAPPNPPTGNRRGSFAATPEGHAGASGSPAAASGNAASGAGSGGSGKDTGSASTGKGSTDLPAGLYVGSAAAKPSPVAGNKPSTNSVNPNLTASVHPPRVSSAPSRSVQPESAAKLSEPERAVFGNRKFYSVTLNMPNLNSAGGSWVIRFAELNHDSNNHDSNNHDLNSHDANSPADDLSQPAATRKVDPAYPLQLMRENVAGTVILYAIIHADGTVGNVRVLRGVDDRLDLFASQAIAQWQFHPAMKNGSPVDVEATFQIPFRPAHPGANF